MRVAIYVGIRVDMRIGACVQILKSKINVMCLGTAVLLGIEAHVGITLQAGAAVHVMIKVCSGVAIRMVIAVFV